MNVFDNEIVLEFLEGSIIFRDIPTSDNKTQIRYTELSPNGVMLAETGSVAFGPSGSWENISPISPGNVWQLIGTSVNNGDGFLAPNEFWVDPTQILPGPTGREVLLIQDAIDLADTLFPGGESIVIRLREGQDHAWAAASLALPTRDITITAVGQVVGEEVDAAAAGRIRIDGAGAILGSNAGVIQRNFEIRNLAVTGPLLVHQGWNLTLREAIVDNFDLTVDQGGAGAVNPVRLLLEDTSGDSARYAGGESVITITTSNEAGGAAPMTTIQANRCELQGVSSAAPEQFMLLGNVAALFDGCTFNIKSESSTEGLWIGTVSPCSLEFTGASSIVGDFLGTGFVRPLFSSSGATPLVRFTGLTVGALDAATGLPTPTWSWGTLTPQGYPRIQNARPPIAVVPGASVTDETIAGAASGLGAITERVMSDLGITVTGGRLVYGTTIAVRPAGAIADTFVLIPLSAQTASGPLFPPPSFVTLVPLVANRVYSVSVTAVMRNSIGVGWTAGTLEMVFTVNGVGTAAFVSGPTWTPVPGGDATFSLDADFVNDLRVRVKAAPGVPLITAGVETEMRILAI